ncbi:Peptidoglycan O-acetyltransferase [uncultured bacterium]|nr:Peptidoglycan O-acetyltransferase [uncultured bacterium]
MNLASVQMLGWIALTIALFWAAPRRFQPYVAAASCALLLLVFSPVSFVVLSIFTALGYVPFRYGRRSAAGALCAGGAVAAVFIWFKSGAATGGALVPLGFGFYTLRALHYGLDSVKRALPPHTYWQFVSYMFFLPTIIAGPINRFQEFHRELARRRFDKDLFSKGCERILYGFVKIIVLASYEVSHILRLRIEAMEGQHEILAAYLDCIRYGLNLYFQFSGYSDVAIGFSMLLGFRIAENFNYPFLARNIGDFWKRWHISLSNWCRDYVYMMALSVSRRPWAAVIASMLVLGVWHELSPRYLAWGVYHGAGIAVWQGFQKVKKNIPAMDFAGGKYLTEGASYLLTMNFVILGFAITKEPDLASGLRVIGKILFFWV